MMDENTKLELIVDEILNESSISRVLSHTQKDGFIQISAFLSDLPLRENLKRTKELEQKIKLLGYSYIKTRGYWASIESDDDSLRGDLPDTDRINHGREYSFMVFPYIHKEPQDFDTFIDDMKSLGRHYNQYSILICKPNQDPYLYNFSYGFTKNGKAKADSGFSLSSDMSINEVPSTPEEHEKFYNDQYEDFKNEIRQGKIKRNEELGLPPPSEKMLNHIVRKNKHKFGNGYTALGPHTRRYLKGETPVSHTYRFK